MTVVSLEIKSPDDIEHIFTTLRETRPDALTMFGGGAVGPHVVRIAAFALENRLPTIYTVVRFPAAGGLMSYGSSHEDLYRRAAYYVDKIFRGINPADLPVEQPIKFDLTINLKTAKALGITIPPIVLYQATKVIR